MTSVTQDNPIMTDPQSAAEPARRRVPLPLILFGVIALAAATFGVSRYRFARTHVTTDNAQVDGHITPIAPKVQAFVSRVLVEDNQKVRAGDTLLVLDERDLRVRVAQAEADLRSAQAEAGSTARGGAATAALAAARSNAGGAESAVAAAEAAVRKTSADLTRYRTLAAQKVISAQQLDQAQWAYDNARAALDAAAKQAAAGGSMVQGAESEVAAASARMAAARSALETAQLQLGYAIVTAPASGIVAKRAVEVGALVQPGQQVMALVPDSGVWVTANLKETQVERVHVGASVAIEVDAYPGVVFHGTVESLSPATGARFALLPPDNATGNFTKVVQRVPVRIRVEPGQNPSQPLRPGMSASVTILTG
jgi:membrane fusion protein (multidrug efflux system)